MLYLRDLIIIGDVPNIRLFFRGIFSNTTYKVQKYLASLQTRQKEKIKFIQYYCYLEGEDQVYPLLLVRRRRKSSLSDITGT